MDQTCAGARHITHALPQTQAHLTPPTSPTEIDQLNWNKNNLFYVKFQQKTDKTNHSAATYRFGQPRSSSEAHRISMPAAPHENTSGRFLFFQTASNHIRENMKTDGEFRSTIGSTLLPWNYVF